MSARSHTREALKATPAAKKATRAVLDARQKALKLCANALSGFTGVAVCLYVCVRARVRACVSVCTGLWCPLPMHACSGARALANCVSHLVSLS